MIDSELIARLEQASEGSKSLDREIATAVMGEPIEYVVLEGDLSQTAIPMWRYPDMSQGTELRFSRSIDAALTLIPKERMWFLGHLDATDLRFAATISLIEHVGGETWRGVASTPALALCVAALKAKAE